MPYLCEIGHTHWQLHRLGGPSRLRPGLTDTDSESPVFRIARRTQSCFAGERPKATCTSLPFDCCRLTIDYLRDWFKNSINLTLNLSSNLNSATWPTDLVYNGIQLQPSSSRQLAPQKLGWNLWHFLLISVDSLVVNTNTVLYQRH